MPRLKKIRKVAVARFAIHSREHLALIRPANNVLTLCTLYYPEEIRQVKEAPMKPDTKHMELALSLIEHQTIEFKPENYKDRYNEALRKMLSDKVPRSCCPRPDT